MATNPAGPSAPPPSSDQGKSVGELAIEISDKASLLVREEIELAKAEVVSKAQSLGKGAAVAAAAGVFLLAAFAVAIHGFAWLINDIFNFESIWPGFLIEAGLFVLLAALAGVIASRFFQRGAPPTPDMAIQEAQLARERLEEAVE